MAKKSAKKLEEERNAELGRRLRDLVLDQRIAHNRYHDKPGWDEIPGYGRKTWTIVALAMIQAEWRPPIDW